MKSAIGQTLVQNGTLVDGTGDPVIPDAAVLIEDGKITCATKTGAEIMGRGDELGTIEPGKLADLLIVDGDVLGDISILENRENFIAVLQSGRLKAGQLAPRHEAAIRDVG